MGRVHEIMELLKVDEQTAKKVLHDMECYSGLDFSECSQAEFNTEAKLAYATMLDTEEED